MPFGNLVRSRVGGRSLGWFDFSRFMHLQETLLLDFLTENKNSFDSIIVFSRKFFRDIHYQHKIFWLSTSTSRNS